MSAASNIAARDAAQAVIDLIIEAGVEHGVRYWEHVEQAVSEIRRTQVPSPEPCSQTGLKPMNRRESQQFELASMPFGKHEGEAVGKVDLSYLAWLDERDDFAVKLRRYMLSAERKRELEYEDDK